VNDEQVHWEKSREEDSGEDIPSKREKRESYPKEEDKTSKYTKYLREDNLPLQQSNYNLDR
jgi:hypothetical protein